MVMVMVLTHKLTLKVSRNYVDRGWLGGLVAGWLGGWLAGWSTSDYSGYLKANQLIYYIQLSLGGQETTFKVAHLHTKIRLLVQNFQGHMNLYLKNIFGLNLTPTPNLTANMIFLTGQFGTYMASDLKCCTVCRANTIFRHNFEILLF